MGYVTALWKDISTPAGLPITTVSKEGYDAWADKITSAVPGMDRNWFSDLLSVDALEVVGTSLSVASALYFLKKDDTEKLSEILGAMGVIGIATANPLLGIAAVLLTAHAYAVGKHKLEGKSVAVGSGLALVSVGLFTILGMAVLVELGIALVVTALIRKQVLGRDNLLRYLRGKIGALPGRFSTVTTIRIPKFINS